MIKPGTIRFLLAIIVVVGHVAPMWVFLGYFAVIVFFILSGYWISHLYDQQYTQLQRPVPVFYVSRIWRLMPMLTLFVLLAVLVNYFFNREIFEQVPHYSSGTGLMYWLSHIFMLGLAQQSPRMLAPAWSLDIELQFYLLFPFLYLLIKKYRTPALAVLLLSTAVITFIFSWQLAGKDFRLAHTICYYLFFFVTGMCIYYRSLVFSQRFETCNNILFLFFVLLMYFKIIPQSSRIANELLPLLLVPLISNSVRRKTGKTDNFLGNISYVLYLAHWVCYIALENYFHFSDLHLPPGKRLLYVYVYLICTGFVSYVAYIFIDKKINMARKKWVATRAGTLPR